MVSKGDIIAGTIILIVMLGVLSFIYILVDSSSESRNFCENVCESEGLFYDEYEYHSKSKSATSSAYLVCYCEPWQGARQVFYFNNSEEE